MTPEETLTRRMVEDDESMSSSGIAEDAGDDVAGAAVELAGELSAAAAVNG
jgi:hypothetical protein